MRQIDATTLKGLLDRGEVELVDVREPTEFASGHVPGARNIPLGSLKQADLSGTKRLVLICASGRRSTAGCEAIEKNLGREVLSLPGGLSAWRAAGGPVEGQGGFAMPRNLVILLLGSLAVLGLILLR